MPIVSVILTSFNQERYANVAVESVLGQTFQDFELLVVDNGSTDGSAALLREYEPDPRVKLFLYSTNESLSMRFNDAIAASTGEFISFLYADDWYLPDKLERQVAEFDQLGPEFGVVYGPAAGLNELTGARWFHPSLRATGDVFEDLMLRSTTARVDMLSPMTRRECLLVHRFDTAIFAETEAIYLRIALTHRFSYVNQPGVVLRDHGDNAGKAIRSNLDLVQRSLTNLRSHPALTEARRALVDHYEADTLLVCGWGGIRVGADPKWARRCLVAAVRLRPTAALNPKIGAGLLLSILPPLVRDLVNRAGHSLKRAPGNATYVEDYYDVETDQAV